MIINQTGGGSGELPLNIISVKKPMPGVAAYESTDDICSGTPNSVIFPGVRNEREKIEAFNYGTNKYISVASGFFVFTHYDVTSNTMVVDKKIKYKTGASPYANKIVSYVNDTLIYQEGGNIDVYNDSGLVKSIQSSKRIVTIFYNGSNYIVKYSVGSTWYTSEWSIDVDAGTITDTTRVTPLRMYDGLLLGAFKDCCFVLNYRASPYTTVEKWIIEGGSWVIKQSYPNSQKSNASNLFSTGMAYFRLGVGSLRGIFADTTGANLPNIIMGPDVNFPESTKTPLVRIWIGDAYADRKGIYYYDESGTEFTIPYGVSTQTWEITPKVMVYSPEPSKVNGGLRVGDELIIF